MLLLKTGALDKMSTIVKVMVWLWIGDKPLINPILTQIYDATWNHKATTS